MIWTMKNRKLEPTIGRLSAFDSLSHFEIMSLLRELEASQPVQTKTALRIKKEEK